MDSDQHHRSRTENELIGKFLNSYQQREFIKADGSLDQTTNVEEWTRMLTRSYGLILNGEKQQIHDFTIYPSEYFTPYDYLNGKSPAHQRLTPSTGSASHG